MLTELTSVYTTSSTPTVDSYWNPRPELTHPQFSTLTLIFISSLRIFYKKWSDDPIFPADQEVYLEGERKPWFRNSDPRARPLACINYIEVCLGDGTTCWAMNDRLPLDASNTTIRPPPDFWLMYASLLKTDIYNAIEKRLGRGLIAQSKVSQYFSDALEDHHWVKEVERFVATSHARTQINAWSIAKGEDSSREGKDRYTLITPKDPYGDLCGMFKYNPPNYASIRFVPFVLILSSFPIFLLLSRDWPWKTHPDAEETRLNPPEAESSRISGSVTTTGAGEIVSSSGSGAGGIERRPGHDSPATRAEPTSARRTAEMSPTSTTRTSNDSEEIKWEPLVIGKIIEWAVRLCVWLQRLLILLVWRLPLRAFG